MKYQLEIDGLRAIAVVPVILFHSGVTWLGGGFVGVDVFFVISGYLITSILVGEMREGSFSLRRFYERRARRILPPLFFMILAVLPFAWLILGPHDLKEFHQSLLAIPLFSSNFLFWQQSGYFDTEAELKPMLHTWSLAVEEQYYVLFPLLLLALCKMGLRRLFAVIGVVAAGSFIYSQLLLRNDPSAAFFLLPARAWELLLGSLTACGRIGWCAARVADGLSAEAAADPLQARPRLANAASALGLAMIVGSMLLYTDQTPFPGAAALLPTLGTVLVILCARRGTLVGRLLTLRPLVFIGLISYSAYLWHQPLLALARHLAAEDLPLSAALSLGALALLLAAFSWRFVEQPFRNRRTVPARSVALASVAGIGIFASLGAAGSTFPDAVENLRMGGTSAQAGALRTLQTRDTLIAERDRVLRDPYATAATEPFAATPASRKVLVLGDSMSNDLFDAARRHADLFPGLEIRRSRLDETCMAAFDAVLHGAAAPAPERARDCGQQIGRLTQSRLLDDADVVVLSANWTTQNGVASHAGALALAQTLAARGRDVRMVGLLVIKEATGVAHTADARALSLAQANELAYASIRWARIRQPNEDARALAEGSKVRYLDKLALFCDASARRCDVFDAQDRLMFCDGNHVTVAGAELYARRMAAQGWLR
jgi:peptidoglycan/LPS O-acetylase OafA/YrhL